MANVVRSFRATTISLLLLLVASNAAGVVSGQGVDCVAPCDEETRICTYNVKVNLFAGELGYFTFDECVGEDGEDIINPTIGMQVGKTYKFSQVSICECILIMLLLVV